jgi:Flp pilus assembly protein TadG
MQQLLRTRNRRDSERGAVVVLVAIWLPVLAIFVSFAVDFAHFYDYSRNLQNRADAAAMAASVAYGNTCLGSYAATDTDSIGKVAQQYAGPPNGAGYTSGVSGQLPYAYSTYTQSQYQNVPNLTKGTSTNFGMRLNSTQNWPNGQNWSMGSSGHTGNSTALCSSTDEDGKTGAMVDVRLTQRNLGLFFGSIFHNVTPTINAHARAALEGEASTNSAPIAVGDSGFTPCVSVRLVNATTNSLIQTVTLAKEPTDPLNPTAPAQWDNSATPASFKMPNSDNVYAQPFLNDCNGNGQTYDDSTNTGLLMINNHPATDPTVNSGQPPQVNSGGVTVNGACANSTQYFSSQTGGCTVRVNAMVTFASDVTPAAKAKVFLVEHQWNNTTNAWVTNQTQMNPPGNGNGNQCNPGTYCLDVTLPDSNGIDQFSLKWEEDKGFIGTTDCSGNPTPAVCTGDFNSGAILQQAFAACNGCDQPDDSGPVIFSRISEVNNTNCALPFPCNDTNSFAGGSTHNLIFTFKLSGVNTAAPGDPATVLRFANSTNHQTGLVDCGQGNSGSNDSQVVYYGCGPSNPLVPGMNPLFVYSRPPGSDCSPAADGNTTGWPNGNQQDCVQTTPGQRRQAIICPLVQRIVGAPFGGPCNNGAPGTCPYNHWTDQTTIPSGDPRAITMIITSDVDLATGTGQPQAWLPIRKFATFYVTGWDSNINPSCTSPSLGSSQNEAFPTKGKRNSQDGAVWGHWISYEDTAGTPNGQLCVVGTSPTNCVPALTR